MENNMETAQKIKIGIPYDSYFTSGYLLEEYKNTNLKRYMLLFTLHYF